MAGNPLADLTWYRGDVKIDDTTIKNTERQYSKSELVIRVNRSDNGIQYRCEASNKATPVPKNYTTPPLKVHFKPDNVEIEIDPELPKAGQKAILSCTGGSSNPPANIIWSFNGTRRNGSTQTTKPGDNGGVITTSKLEIEVEAEHEGAYYVCEARNEAMMESVHEGLQLRVKCKLQNH